MDAFCGLLDGPRARGAFLLRSLLDPPWAIRIRDEAPLTVVAVVRGGATVTVDGGEPVRLDEGDVGILRGPTHYTVADAPDTPPQIVIWPGERCTTPDGREVEQDMHLGVRTWGTSLDGPDVLLTGTYEQLGELSQPLLDSLPPLLVLPAEELRSPLVPMLASEIVRDGYGQESVLDRLLDLLLIATLRAWFDLPDTPVPSWYRGHDDPVVGVALRAMQHNPAHPWTVASLASEAGVSRAALARRFQEVVGEAPMGFLTGWRLALGADLLLEPGATVGSVADQVGYGSAFAFSSAFKRVRGVSPAAHREAAAAIPSLTAAA